MIFEILTLSAFFLINPFSYSYVLVGIIMVYISLSLLKLLYWLFGRIYPEPILCECV